MAELTNTNGESIVENVQIWHMRFRCDCDDSGCRVGIFQLEAISEGLIGAVECSMLFLEYINCMQGYAFNADMTGAAC
ncbi:hypothetical protein RvY_04179 [Ramazzottius varieornatus]|uniref:Uncharacterized protein n=1 Tax=Ramazzottius varieornatus TaxID=947166 RepID=A0A1D1UU37_RAMVA|nr:hypothetical protein RvY_04179 [Ramazzottius varieornatus]